jgi:hypothetical protein
MKTTFFIATLLISATSFSADGPFQLSCRFQGLKVFSPSDSQVGLQCDRGNVTLSGTNNSPCQAATHLSQYFLDAKVGEPVQIQGLTYNSSGMGGMETHTDVVVATRAGTAEIFEAPTILNHGRPKKCNTTHVSILSK